MVVVSAAALCTTCGARLAHDHLDTICSPCRRTEIESSARRGAMLVRESARIAAVFEALGLYGVAEQFDLTPAEALDVLFSSALLPSVSPRRRLLLRQLVDLRDHSHVAAAEELHISRWTVATYRQLLGIERDSAPALRPRVW
jgi:hypothetical protein